MFLLNIWFVAIYGQFLTYDLPTSLSSITVLSLSINSYLSSGSFYFIFILLGFGLEFLFPFFLPSSIVRA